MTYTISGYTTSLNCIEMEYPIELCIKSLLPFCSEVIVVDGGSTDGTVELLNKMSAADPRIKVFVEPVDFSNPRWAIHQDGYLKQKARSKCTGTYCWQTDSDEVVDPSSYDKIQFLPEILKHTGRELVMLPMCEFWGSFDLIRADFMSWKNRFSVNAPHIVHGIPAKARAVDSNGHEYPKPFESDTCNYIDTRTGEDVAAAIPIGIGVDEYSSHTYDQRKEWFMSRLDLLPHVLHVSWLSFERKIAHYKKFWQRFHASMYNLVIEDNAATNVMFDKPWSEVTEADIRERARELAEIGPRSFHQKINREKIGLTFPFIRPILPELKSWHENLANKKAVSRVVCATPTAISVTSPPLVSVVVPSYNKAQFLAETVESVLKQDYSSKEIIIVNDGSSDNTSEVARSLIAQYPARRISLVEQSNMGAPTARNSGIERAQGELFVALDGDDILLPTFLSRSVQAMHDHKANVVMCNLQKFGTETDIWEPAAYNDYVIRYDNVIPIGSLCEKRLWKLVGGFKRAFTFSEDWEFWLSCSEHGMEVYRINEPLFLYRVTGHGLSSVITNSHEDVMSLMITSHPHLYPVEEIMQAHRLLMETIPQRFITSWEKRDKVFSQEWYLKFWLGCRREGLGDIEGALQLQSQAAHLTNYKNWQPIYRIAQMLYQAGDIKNAREFLVATRTLRPDMKKIIEPLMQHRDQVSLTPS